MTTAIVGLTTLLIVLVAAGAWLLDRMMVREAAHRASEARERAWLYQRLQAPSVAVAQFDPGDSEEPPPIEPSEEEMRVFHSEQDEILHNAGRL